MTRAYVGVAVLIIGCSSSTTAGTAGDAGGSDATTNDGGSPHDASMDASIETSPGGTGSFECGNNTCMVATQECCIDDMASPVDPACVARGTCTKRVVACLQTSHCPSGDLCCGKFVPITSMSNGFVLECAAQCASDERQACATTPECTMSGAKCVGTQPGFCTVPDAGSDASDAASE